jgi:glutathione S-transferase
MEPLLENPAFRVYAICSALLGIKMLASAVYTATRRQKTAGFINPEDVQAFAPPGTTVRGEEASEVAHALRIQRNDGENIPLFFAVGLIYVLTGASAFGAAVLCGLFTAARIAHTFAYAYRKQPARAICFAIGAACMLVMIFRIFVNVL